MGLASPEIQILDSWTDETVAEWEKYGCPKSAFETVLQNQRWEEKVGQRPPAAKKQSLTAEETLEPIPNREATSWDTHHLEEQVQEFMAAYPQIVQCPENARLFYDYLKHNHAVANRKNLEACVRHRFTEFTLQTFAKVADEPAAQKRRYAAMPIFPRPIKTKIVTTVLSPDQVKKLSADEHARLQSPMAVPQITESANEAAKVVQKNFHEENPENPHLRKQSTAVTRHEYAQFLKQYPGYARLANIPGVTDLIVSYVDEGVSAAGINPQTPSVEAFKDAIEYLADSVGIFTLTDADRGLLKAQVSTLKVSGGSPRHYTDSYALRKKVNGMTSEEYNTALQDPEFRAQIDEFLD